MSPLGWKYYNRAMIPDCAPHEQVNTACIEDGSIWNSDRKPLLARWTTDFDCGYETNWWYIIKDDMFDISQLKAKRRYEINKGTKNFEVKVIVPGEHIEEIYDITKKAYESWPKKYRPDVNYDKIKKSVLSWKFYKVYGIFQRESGKMCGYACLSKDDEYINFNLLRVIPEYEKYGINAAAVHKVVTDNNDCIEIGGYICDGARSVNHETAFQEYLEKYFGFRKAYCKLHIAYNPKLGKYIGFLWLVRKILRKFDCVSFVHKLNVVLKMEEIARKCN